MYISSGCGRFVKYNWMNLNSQQGGGENVLSEILCRKFEEYVDYLLIDYRNMDSEAKVTIC